MNSSVLLNELSSPDLTTKRGYCGIGIWHGKKDVNFGTLVRSARALGADFAFTVGRRYDKQPSACGAHRHLPIFNYETLDSLRSSLPVDGRLVCVEIPPPSVHSYPLQNFCHPQSAIYLLGAEDHGLPEHFLREPGNICVHLPGRYCLNVASAGSIVLYDRLAKA